jgi:hypothetical protein
LASKAEESLIFARRELESGAACVAAFFDEFPKDFGTAERLVFGHGQAGPIKEILKGIAMEDAVDQNAL